jgi:hypothetical protein
MTEKEKQNLAKADLMEAVIQLLSKQGDKFNPSELLALLALCNTLGVVSFLTREKNTNPKLANIAALAKELTEKGDIKSRDSGETQGLINNLISLVATKGERQLNPATLLALVNMLSEAETKKKPTQSELPPPPGDNLAQDDAN